MVFQDLSGVQGRPGKAAHDCSVQASYLHTGDVGLGLQQAARTGTRPWTESVQVLSGPCCSPGRCSVMLVQHTSRIGRGATTAVNGRAWSMAESRDKHILSYHTVYAKLACQHSCNLATRPHRPWTQLL